MNQKQVEELLLQSLEHELGGVTIYSTALSCARRPELKREWERYLEQTKQHVTALEGACKALKLDPARDTPGRRVVRHVGSALVEAMNLALSGGDATAAQLVACECVVLAETKDHANWQLLGKVAERLPGEAGAALERAYRTIEDQEDEHLYHSRGWCRELQIEALGLPALLPPPEEQREVKTAMGAARAEQLADELRLQGQRR